jgi:hypothetical protein
VFVGGIPAGKNGEKSRPDLLSDCCTSEEVSKKRQSAEKATA